MSGLVRIRLNFQHSLSVPEASNCWFLVDTSTCRTISDLEYLIKKRFGVSSKNAVINLFLDDYLLPSQEKIEIIQPSDNIRVDLKEIRAKQSTDEDESDQDSERKVKRKRENGSLSDARIETKTNSVKKSSLCAVTKSKSSKTSERREHKHLKSGAKPSHTSQKLVSTTKPYKRKSTVETSKTNAKKSKTNNKSIENDFVADQNGLDSDSSSSESSSSTESAVEYTSKKKSNFATSKPNAEKTSATTMHHKAKGCVGTKTALDGGCKSSESSNFTEPGPLEKHHPKSATILNGVKFLEPKTSKQPHNCDKSQSHKGQGKDVLKKFQSEVAIEKVKGGSTANGIAAKSSAALQGKKQEKFTASAKVSSSSSSSTDSSESEDSERKTGKCNEQETQLSSSSSSASPSPLPSLPSSSSSSSSPSLSPSPLPSLPLSSSSSSSPSSLSSHSSTFYPTSAKVDEKLNVKVDDTHKEKSEDASKKVYPASSTSTQSSILPSSSSLSKENKEATIMTGGTHRKNDRYSNMDPVLCSSSLPSVSFSSSVMKGSSNTALPGLSTSKSTRWKTTQRQGSSMSLKSHIRFGSEDETSEGQGSCFINDSTDVFDETRLYTFTPDGTCEQRNETSSTKAVEQTEPAQRDYTQCTPLHGPPRANDKIAYKVLELSASYTPEMSNYKEGTVLSYDLSTGAVTIDLTKESLKKTPGDGNITRKFELIYDNEECNADNEEVDTRTDDWDERVSSATFCELVLGPTPERVSHESYSAMVIDVRSGVTIRN